MSRDLALVVTAFATSCGSDAGGSTTSTSIDSGTTQVTSATSSFAVVPAPSLDENLLGDAAQLNVALWLHRDLVTYVDANYRTLPNAGARGIAGFSMGGFGAIDLAMRHPDVFGAVYALSAGLMAPNGLETTQMFDDDADVADFWRCRRTAPTP